MTQSLRTCLIHALIVAVGPMVTSASEGICIAEENSLDHFYAWLISPVGWGSALIAVLGGAGLLFFWAPQKFRKLQLIVGSVAMEYGAVVLFMVMVPKGWLRLHSGC